MSGHARTRPRPIEDRIEIAVPALVDEATFAAAGRRLEDNRRFSARNTKEPSLLMGLVACQSCGYAYYRTSTRTKSRKLYYYRCLGSDDYRYEHGRVCTNQPVRSDYLEELVWSQVTALLADPALVQAELDRRLTELRAANPATAERSRLELELTRATKGIERLVHAYQEDLLTLDELRARMPDLRAKEASLRGSLASLDAQLLDRETYLKLAENLEGFLGRLRDTADTATIGARQKVLRSVVKEVLVGAERVVIRHSIPGVDHPFRPPGYRLRLRCHDPALRGPLLGRSEPTVVDHTCFEPLLDEPPRREATEGGEKMRVIDAVERRCQVRVEHPAPLSGLAPHGGEDASDRVVATTARPEAIGLRLEPCLPLGLQRVDHLRLAHAVHDHGNPQRALLPVGLGYVPPLDGLGHPLGGAALHRVGHDDLPRCGHHDAAVDARRLATSVELGHPPHAHQRIGARPEHQLLQVADLCQVPIS
jgi:hypothetical protein